VHCAPCISPTQKSCSTACNYIHVRCNRKQTDTNSIATQKRDETFVTETNSFYSLHVTSESDTVPRVVPRPRPVSLTRSRGTLYYTKIGHSQPHLRGRHQTQYIIHRMKIPGAAYLNTGVIKRRRRHALLNEIVRFLF